MAYFQTALIKATINSNIVTDTRNGGDGGRHADKSWCRILFISF